MVGCMDKHKVLEDQIAEFHSKEDSVIFPSCYAANVGFFLTFFNEKDVLISDNSNHSSLIDGMRLAKSKKVIFKHLDYAELEKRLQETKSYRTRVVVVEGVYSMDGDIADLARIIALCKNYNAILVLDDSHGVGAIGKTGRGAIEYCGVDPNDVDFIISTLGKALGGANGGYICTSKLYCDWIK
jgi:glycine C-acetyltransferase